MSSVAPVSAQLSSAMTFSTGAVGGAAASAPGAASALSEPGAANGALGVQTSLLMQSSQGMNNVDQLAALALALLLGKSSESKGGGNDDPWKMLVAMAMLSGMSGQGSSVSMSQNVSIAPDAYAAGAVTAGANVNLQG